MTDWLTHWLSPGEIEAIGLSLRVAFWAMAWSLPIAIVTAWLLARCRFPGRGVLDALIHLPLVLPPVVIGYGLLVLFGRNGAIGGWLYDLFGITVAFTWRGAAIASAVVAFPLVVRAIRLSLETVDLRLEDGNGLEVVEALRQQVRQAIGPIATPDCIQVVPGLPKTRSGKIMRRILRSVAAGEYEDLGDVSTLADPSVVDAIVAGHRRA